jgi:hypothetical protein
MAAEIRLLAAAGARRDPEGDAKVAQFVPGIAGARFFEQVFHPFIPDSAPL